MENQELAQEAKAQTPANDAAQIDTKALNAVMSRLDKLEAKSNRPGAPAIMLGEATEQKAFTNYLRVGEARMEATEAKALAVANNANGGYLVPPEQGSEILKLLTEMSPLRQYANIQTVTGSEITFPTLLSGVNAFWTEEGADMTVSKPTFGQIKIANHELSSFYVANNKVLEDNAYDLEGEMNREGAPTTDELRTMGNALYKQVDDAGVQVKPEAFSALRKSLLDRLRSNTGYDELPGPGRLTPNTGRVMEIMQQADNTLSATPTAALPFKNLDQMRRQAGAAAGNVTNKTDQAAGMSVIGGLDDFVQRLGPDDVVAGDP